MPPSSSSAEGPSASGEKAGQDLLRNEASQMREGLQKPSHVSQVFLQSAGASPRVQKGPDFSAKDVLDRGDGKRPPQDLPPGGPHHEVEVARVGLDLDAKVGAWLPDVQAVRETLDPESVREKTCGAVDVVGPRADRR